MRHFLNDICPELDVSVVPIADLYGPTQYDPTMELLILSAETIKGGQKINEGKFYNQFDIVIYLIFSRASYIRQIIFIIC